MNSVQGSWGSSGVPEPGGRRPAPDRHYGWWFAECPRHGRTPHLTIFGGLCERCAAEREVVLSTKRTRQ